MEVLILCLPGMGHYNPCMQLARALRRLEPRVCVTIFVCLLDTQIKSLKEPQDGIRVLVEANSRYQEMPDLLQWFFLNTKTWVDRLTRLYQEGTYPNENQTNTHTHANTHDENHTLEEKRPSTHDKHDSSHTHGQTHTHDEECGLFCEAECWMKILGNADKIPRRKTRPDLIITDLLMGFDGLLAEALGADVPVYGFCASSLVFLNLARHLGRLMELPLEEMETLPPPMWVPGVGEFACDEFVVPDERIRQAFTHWMNLEAEANLKRRGVLVNDVAAFYPPEMIKDCKPELMPIKEQKAVPIKEQKAKPATGSAANTEDEIKPKSEGGKRTAFDDSNEDSTNETDNNNDGKSGVDNGRGVNREISVGESENSEEQATNFRPRKLDYEVVAIGPLVKVFDDRVISSQTQEKDGSGSANADDLVKGCANGGGVRDPDLEWLNEHEAKSVVFVSMGSSYDLSPDDLLGLAHTLELLLEKRPDLAVLWALRPAANRQTGDEFGLPKAWVAEHGERVRVSRWVNQVCVIRHTSVILFITHGGWNGLLESTTLHALPLICLPLAAEQPLNAKCVTEYFRTGQKLWRSPHLDQTLDPHEALHKIVEVLDKESEYRANATHYHTLANQAWEGPDAPSRANLIRVIQAHLSPDSPTHLSQNSPAKNTHTLTYTPPAENPPADELPADKLLLPVNERTDLEDNHQATANPEATTPVTKKQCDRAEELRDESTAIIS